MNGEREFEFLAEPTTHLSPSRYNHNNNNNNSNYYHNQGISNGFCFPDVGSSSIPSFDHSPKNHFVDQFSTLPDSWYDRGNNGVLSDELGLATEFHRMNIGNTGTEFNSSDVGKLGRNTDGFRINDYNVPKIRPFIGQNFRFSEGFINGFSGNLGFPAPLYRDERNSKDEFNFRLGDSFESTLPYRRANYHLGGICDQNVSNPWDFSQNLSMYRSLFEVPYYGNMAALTLNTIETSSELSKGNNKLYNSIREIPESFTSMKKGYESNFTMKEKGGQNKSCDPVILQCMYDTMAESQSNNIYLMAKEQQGCRFLQKKFEKGSFEDVQLIFNELIDHIIELMVNPSGNYLIQKLLEVCNEEQRMRIVLAVTRERGELIRICLNSHGTRVAQKLIETLKTKKQILLIVRALEPGFVDLIKDLNGNHVVQRCLRCLSSEDNKFIFDSATKFCVEIATHRHGCCVLQRCIAHSSGEHQKMLVERICANALHLAQDPYGNYVVQYIIELKIPEASAQLTSKFEGHYIQLSAQKFSSHVVEKCLKFIEKSRARIVYELLSVSHFEQLLQDPYANYVIQSALEVTKGAVNESLVAALRPHSMLRTNPYCKKIFSHGMLKK